MTKRDKPITKGGNKQSEAIPIRQTATADAYTREKKSYDEKHPISILEFSNRGAGDRGLHPTQKPLGLMEYLIRTYTQVGDVVLDNCMGSGSTGVACVNTSRGFIGMEKDRNHFDTASDRIACARGAPLNQANKTTGTGEMMDFSMDQADMFASSGEVSV
jgi:DNA modification methylase